MKSKAKSQKSEVKSSESQVSGVAFICNRVAGVIPQEFLFENGFGYRPVSCIGQIGVAQILNAFEYGAERVLLIGCPDSECRHQVGPKTVREQVEVSKNLLGLLGLTRERVQFIGADSEDGVKQGVARFKAIGRQATIVRKEVEQGVQLELKSSKGFVCEDCGRCSGICPVTRTGLGFSPRRLLQQAVVNRTAVSSRALYTCLGCELCNSVCPAGVAIDEEILRHRVLSFQEGMSPVLAHGGAIQTLGRMMTVSGFPQNRRNWLEPSLRVAEKGETAIFTGCLPYFDVLFKPMGIDFAQTLRNAVQALNAIGVEPVILGDERCCGHDLLWQGDVESFQMLARHNLNQLRDGEVKRVVFLCPECLRTFKVDYSRFVESIDLELLHISQFLTANGFKPNGKNVFSGRRVTYQDPCRLGRHLGVYDAPRQLITGVKGVQLVEMEHYREGALCCGGTSWLECGAAVRRLQERRLTEAKATGTKLLVTACAKCQIHLACAQRTLGLDDLKIVDLIDFIYVR